jgi:flagellin
MALIINTNIASLTAQRNLGLNNTQLQKSLERLSSGLRVNRSADDAAGLSIANKLSFQSRGLNQAVRNAGDATSLVQTAEGAFNVVTNILGRLRELAVQAASDTNTTADRQTLKSEADLLTAELTRLATTTQFNGANLLDGSFSSGKVQVGANADQTISFSLADARASQLGKFTNFSADIANGVGSTGAAGQSGFGAFTAGEFNINGQLVGATATTDDQVSVLELFYKAAGVGAGSIALGSGLTSATAGLSEAAISFSAASASTSNIAFGLAAGTTAIYINGTAITSLANGCGTSLISVGITGSTVNAYSSNSAFVSAFVAKVNAAGITNVTARQNVDGSTYALVSTKGTDIKLAVSNAAGVAVGSALSNYGLASQIVGSGNASVEVSTYNGQSGAIAKAAAINTVSSRSGVTATAQGNAFSQTTAIAAGALVAGDLIINGISIDATTGITASDGTGGLRAAINAKTALSGVVASVNTSGGLVLSATDGRNISIFSGASGVTVAGVAAGVDVYRAAIKFVSNDAVTFTGTTTDVGNLNTNTSYTPDLTNSLSLLDISTQVGANTAITSIDAALSQVSKSRSDVGALQSRLDLTVQSLQTASENQKAAESRIRDADFAYETAVFTRNQILVQAGTAILAQANSSTQIALQLLK